MHEILKNSMFTFKACLDFIHFTDLAGSIGAARSQQGWEEVGRHCTVHTLVFA